MGLVVAGLAVLVVLAGSSLARTTNVAQLDDGTCGRNLQIGSDKTASSSATPSFLLWGDGGLSSYQIFIDGASIGTFASDGFANVCITASVPLANGPHVLTGNELAPHNTYTVTPFSFSVDTVPPAQPSTPVISGYSDSGLLGDHITKYRNVNFTGFSDPNVAIQLYNGISLLGGAKADASGHWSATTSTLSDGSYTITAAAFDDAGNKSMLSLNCPLTIDATAPTGALTSPLNGATVAGSAPITATASDSGGVWKVDFQIDGVTQATVSASPYIYPWNSSSVANGSHTLTALISDYAGNTTTSTATITVQNAASTAPAAPSLNSANAGNGSVTLAWSAPASNGGSAVTGYRVYRSGTSGGETLLTTLGSVTTWTDSGLSNGSTYYYKLSALNAIGESPLSSERFATPAAAATVAGAPSLTLRPRATAASRWPGRRRPRTAAPPHRLPGLPLRHQRRRDAAHDPGARHQLHEHRLAERQHLLLQAQRPQRDRRKPPLQRALRHTRCTRHNSAVGAGKPNGAGNRHEPDCP
jgi:hypothetical protein